MPNRLSDEQVQVLMAKLPRFDGKADNLKHALAAGDWHRVLSCAPKNGHEERQAKVERPANYGESGPSLRWDVFFDIEPHLTDMEYWTLLGRVWTECEKAIDQGKGMTIFFPQNRNTGLRAYMMDDIERRELDMLPAQFTVYRGGRLGAWSWTLVKHLAEDFKSTEGSDKGGEKPKDPDDEVGVHERLCRKEDVIALLLCKGEAEVVVNWNKLVKPDEEGKQPHPFAERTNFKRSNIQAKTIKRNRDSQ
jgi:hypothetical protein